MTEQQPQSTGRAFLRSIGDFLRFLLRFLFVLVMGVLLAMGLYYGVPWLYRNMVQPVQENTSRISVIEQRMDLEEERLQEENRKLKERIVTLETELSQLQEDVSVQEQDQQALEEQDRQIEERVSQLEGDLDSQQQSVESLRAELEGAIAEVSEQATETQEQLAEVTAELDLHAQDTEERLDELEGRLALLQAAQDLLKIRLLLLEENPRLARDAVTLTLGHLDRAIALMPAQAETLKGLQERTAALDELINTNSYRVRPDLESLWADLMDLVLPLAFSAQTTSPLPTPTP